WAFARTRTSVTPEASTARTGWWIWPMGCHEHASDAPRRPVHAQSVYGAFGRQEAVMRPAVVCAAILGSIMAGTARAADVELLGQPCRAKQVLGTCLVTDRQDGRERLVMLNDNESSHCELL